VIVPGQVEVPSHDSLPAQVGCPSQVVVPWHDTVPKQVTMPGQVCRLEHVGDEPQVNWVPHVSCPAAQVGRVGEQVAAPLQVYIDPHVWTPSHVLLNVQVGSPGQVWES
jgi:hypothetical protein